MMEPLGTEEYVESEEPVAVPPSAPLSTGPLHYDILDDDEWED
jgi:hypothetical protein